MTDHTDLESRVADLEASVRVFADLLRDVAGVLGGLVENLEKAKASRPGAGPVAEEAWRATPIVDLPANNAGLIPVTIKVRVRKALRKLPGKGIQTYGDLADWFSRGHSFNEFEIKNVGAITEAAIRQCLDEVRGRTTPDGGPTP